MTELSCDLKLSNGVLLPRVGLGTFRSKGLNVRVAVQAAVDVGIRCIDTASIYKNEADIAAALHDTSGGREAVFLTSKVSPCEMGLQKATAACEAILDRLGTSWVDLVLIHWPGGARLLPNSLEHARLRLETWQVLESFYTAGRFRAIGVSNFTQAHLEQLLEKAIIAPMVNQIEMQPCYPQHALLEYCKAQGIAVTAYASLGCGTLLANNTVIDIAQRNHRSPAIVLLRWALQKGVAVIPNSSKPHRIAEYAEDELLNWELQAADMSCLGTLENGKKFCWDAACALIPDLI